jgi:putative endonuclease
MRITALQRTYDKDDRMFREHSYYVYIMQSPSRRVLYIGVTSKIEKRVWQHKNHKIEGFSSKYNCTRLVHLEHFSDVRTAIDRETQLKKWRRSKKEWLIELDNPRWLDLAEGLGERLPDATKGCSTPDA